MLFNSFEFIFIYLPIVLLVYFGLLYYRLTKIATGALVVASLLFYSYWDIAYLPLLLCSIVFNYSVGWCIERWKQKWFLVFGVAVNLCLLGYFKYSAFFIRTINEIANTNQLVPEIVLPLGISFFTFTQTAYLVDAYRRETKGYSFITYCLFVTIFPHLIAGPILYHKDMIPQFSRVRNFVFSYRNMATGLAIFSLGLFKKVIIADKLAPTVQSVFEHADAVNLTEAWTGALAYTLQLYFDFSGYSEMALGLGVMLNFNLPINFCYPYQALSIIDFWRRWHITLSAFLKNYLYIPLGGNRHGEWRRMRNLFLTMLLGGLWHGAGWTFVIWGGLHGLYLVINHTWRKYSINMPESFSWVITIIAVVFAWVFFRANSLYDAWRICQSMVGLHGMGIIWEGKLWGMIAAFGLLQYEHLLQKKVRYFIPTVLWCVFIFIIFTWSIFSFSHVSEFLYFQF